MTNGSLPLQSFRFTRYFHHRCSVLFCFFLLNCKGVYMQYIGMVFCVLTWNEMFKRIWFPCGLRTLGSEWVSSPSSFCCLLSKDVLFSLQPQSELGRGVSISTALLWPPAWVVRANIWRLCRDSNQGFYDSRNKLERSECDAKVSGEWIDFQVKSLG